MVLEGRIAEMLRNQASRFLRGFTSEQLRLGLLNGRMELQGLALNPEPFDTLLLESEIPLVLKAGVLMSAVAQISLLQGELELTIDGLVLVLSPACRWLTREEIFAHRLNEIQRLEFVHMRSHCQRRTLEHDMVRQLFSDYLSRLKIVVKNVHVRIEVEGEMDHFGNARGANAVVGVVLGSCQIVPVKSKVQPPKAKAGDQTANAANEVLLAETIAVSDVSLYHETAENATLHVSWKDYHSTRQAELGAFANVPQAKFVELMAASCKKHASMHASEQLMPATSFSTTIDLKSTSVRDGFHADSCLVMEITLCLEKHPSRLSLTTCTLEHLQWFVARTLDFQLWQFLHPMNDQPSGSAKSKALARWCLVRSFVALKKRIHSNSYTLRAAITMRSNCKEYVRLYKKKFNGSSSVIPWRKSMPSLTTEDSTRLNDIELQYPADKLVNFRLMAHAELKTEMALNNFLNVEDSGNGGAGGDGQSRRAARELTPLEQLHLHGQHGYGVNIYRGLPTPPSSLKVRIDLQAPMGVWWTCHLVGAAKAINGGSGSKNGWALAVDSVAQPLRVLLVDSVVDSSVFITVETPPAPEGQRPASILLGRDLAAFRDGSPARSGRTVQRAGGKQSTEWLSVFEADGHICCCAQLKTLLTSSPTSPWDFFLHVSCGDPVDLSSPAVASSRGRGSPGSPLLQPAQATSGNADNAASLRCTLPLTMPSGQPGPLVDLLKHRVFVSTMSKNGRIEVSSGAAHSAIAWFARHVAVTRNIAMFRLHFRLPPLLLQLPSSGSVTTHTKFPRFDGAVHLEHGGLVDGFVVGLHNLRHFVASLVADGWTSSGEKSSGGGVRGGGRANSWPLLPFEQAPPLGLMVSALTTAASVALPCGKGKIQDSVLLDAAKKQGLQGLLKVTGEDVPASTVTLVLVLMTIICSRRVNWDHRDSKPGGATDPSDAVEAKISAAVSELHSMAGATLRVLIHMGFPLHSRCMPLAAWAGALDLLEACPKGPNASSSLHGLIMWAARGAHSNLQTRQETVVRWLLSQGARIDECDKGGRSLLDWASWSGSQGLTALALRAGLLQASPRQGLLDTPVPTGSPPPQPPSALTLAVASRAPQVVGMLLRAGCDPHTPSRGSSCGPLLLAVRNCEYELACRVLKGAPFVAVDSALGPAVPNTGHSIGVKGDLNDSAVAAGCVLRATVTLIDSLRRFSMALPRVGEDSCPSMLHGSLRSHSPGPHPDEGLYATGQLPFSDILHPVTEQLPAPLHKVSQEFQQRTPPLCWSLRSSSDPWAPAQLFIECCLKRGFRPDGAVVVRALPALPPNARRVVQLLAQNATPWPTPAGGVTGGDFALELGAAPSQRSLGDLPKENNVISSVVKEIREMREKTPALEHVPPIDLISALGVGAGEPGQTSGSTRTSSGLPPYVLEVRGSPSVWVSIGVEGSTAPSSPVVLQSLSIDDTSIVWQTRSGNTPTVFPLQEVGSGRLFDVSGGEASGRHGLEITLGAHVDVAATISRIMPEARLNGHASGGRPALRLLFARQDESERCLECLRLRKISDRNETLAERLASAGLDMSQSDPEASMRNATTYLQGGSWDPAAVRDEVMSKPSVSTGKLPAVRVVVFGAPRVGKTHVAQCLLKDMGVSERCDGAWMHVAGAPWPKSQPKAQVHVWDTSSAPQPGLLRRLVGDVPLLLVLVVDPALGGIGAPVDSMLDACEAVAGSSLPRRTIVVENVFPGGTPPQQAAQASHRKIVRCDARSSDSCGELRKQVSAALGEIVSEVVKRGGQPPEADQVAKGEGLHISTSLPLPGRGDGTERLLGTRLRGDSSLIDPQLVSWAWATVRAAQGYLAEGAGSSGCGGALVPRERLDIVLGALDMNGCTPPQLIHALANLGLLCPIPSSSADRDHVGCQWVLVPDFAKRVRLASNVTEPPVEPTKSSGSGSGTNGAPTPVSARLVWDGPGTPSLRAMLRDFIGRGVVGSSTASAPSRSLEAHRFVLLEAGPGASKSAGPSSTDGLEPGFLLTFDLSTVPCRVSGTDTGDGTAPSSLVMRPPPSTPGEAVADFRPGDEDLVTSGTGTSPRLTAVIIGTSFGEAGKGFKKPCPFWDVHISGPHAQWAWRALLGGGSSGPGFSSFSRSTGNAATRTVPSAGSWPLPPPACVMSTAVPQTTAPLAERPTGPEFLGLSWLFNGPDVAAVRTTLAPACAAPPGGVAACCAALCGGSSGGSVSSNFDEDRDVDGLPSCADFDLSLLTRNWKMAPRFLDEALAGGAEAWALCATSLARLAHDTAGAVAGSVGRSLPLLAEAGSSKSVMIVLEAPPLVSGPEQTTPPDLGSIRSNAGVEAWLRLCRPVAVWNAAGAARGFVAAGVQPPNLPSGVGTQVVEALKTAFTVRFTDQNVAEVWDSLRGSSASATLEQRAGGTWVQATENGARLL